ncbi:MAG: AAA family ATPase, partial [Clostridia bacterium]|nr:AAA family ATPase [Clostridia bacterium]
TNEGVAIITGGPGTGKTTIIKGILSVFKNNRKKCLLMAPTGRAAKRMEEQTKEPASTIHRALEVQDGKSGKRFVHNEGNPLDADVVIVDEVSMLDAFLMSSLLKALNFGTRLILVGDKDQLPSVGAGNVLADLIASDIFKVVELTQIYRQSEDSMIAYNAHKINNSEMPDLKKKSSDFFYSATHEPQAVANEIVSLITERMPKFFDDLKSEDIQVIAPMKAGLAGVDNLNVLIQEKLNPKTPAKRQIELQKRVFREGDRVMQIVNNYDREWEKITQFGYPVYGEGVFNGDMGRVTEVNTEINEISVTFDDGRRAVYSYAELDEIVLSYAITIHKSQGSEFKAVIIPVMGGSPLLMNKNLLYTAVTRAKKMVVLIGKSSNIFYMVNNRLSATRNTMLKSLLEKNINILN